MDTVTGKNVNPFVIGFINEFPGKLHTQQEDIDSIFATPRSWKRVSDILNAANNRYQLYLRVAQRNQK